MDPDKCPAPDDLNPPRYSYAFDPGEDTTASKVLRLIGPAQRILELGPGPGVMTRVLHERGAAVTAIEYDPGLAELARPFCERLILADLDHLDFDESLGGQRFEAVIAADVLEHLTDPWACLRRVRPLIDDGGVLVVSIPNVAHGAVVAQLLQGRFPYTEQGLLDRTHLRFFARRDVEDLLLTTGFVPLIWERNRLSAAASEFAHAWYRLPEAVREALAREPDAQTYQFIVQAQVADTAGWSSRMRADRENLERDVQRLRAELDHASGYIEAFHQARDLIAERDRSLAERDRSLADVQRARVQAEGLLAERLAVIAAQAEMIESLRSQLEVARMRLRERLARALRRLWPR
ncbi:methyltransferase domain-containing protein [Thioalkalicoccus limnaeus]|uniref:Methyltransferase domain-containing protein n=1 Tax=Thioalkalicoccus limnaeus TaxID=120681 RepID=A0ABV4BGU4_9GAMM